MSRTNETERDLKEVHYQLARVVLFLSRIGFEDQAEATLKLKAALPRPSPPAPRKAKKINGGQTGRVVRTGGEGP